ncbi:MAG: universal stress protein [archaeon]|nr:universal stress protein [archaeon]MCP8306544.1 universal stress protein [archaeon]
MASLNVIYCRKDRLSPAKSLEEGSEFDKRVEFGVTSDIIIEVAEKGNHDLIVLGSRGLGTAKRFLLGSVSDDVSHKAKCSVLIFPAKCE